MTALALLLCVAFNDADASGRKKKDFSVEHPWAGAKVAYLGDSITDPGVLKEDTHYWGFLQQWLWYMDAAATSGTRLQARQISSMPSMVMISTP